MDESEKIIGTLAGWPRTTWELATATISLITVKEFESLPDGTKLMCIDGRYVIKGTDPIDDDTRYGYMAYGFEVEGEEHNEV
jgi:hypothetical protein